MNKKNLIGKGFESHPERINKKGRPPKFVTSVIKELSKRGIENVKPSQIVDLYEKLMNCTHAQIRAFANDPEAVWEVRQTAKYMLKHPEKAWNEIKDRAHGKAKQTQDMNIEGQIDITQITGMVVMP